MRLHNRKTIFLIAVLPSARVVWARSQMWLKPGLSAELNVRIQ
jgi:hypothetical protein